MTGLPGVSVVIATRNRPEMLRSAIAAVVEQAYKGSIECVVVFDQTEPDLTLARDGDERAVRVLTNVRTPGLAGARNTGILASAGDYVAFCDDDDVWQPEKLDRQVREFGDALTSVTGVVIDYGGRQSVRVPTEESLEIKHLVRDRVMAAHPSTVVMRRKAILDQIGLVDEELPGSYAEDFDFLIRAVQAGPVSVVAEPMVLVQWGQSMFSRDWATIVAAIDYLIDKHEVFRADPRALARLYGRRAFALAAMGESRRALKDAWRTFRLSPGEKRSYVTLPVALRLVPATRMLDMAHKRGYGI